jgi:hypothetical protein
MVRLRKKKLKQDVGTVLHTSTTSGSRLVFMCYILLASHVTFSLDPSIFALVFGSLAMAQKLVRALHDRLKIIEQIDKNHGEKRVDIAKRLGLPASTLNTIFAKKNDIHEQIQKYGNACKKRKTGKESTFAELETVLFMPRLLKL